MLKPGLYEQLINNGLKRELDEITEECKSIAQIDKAEAAEIIAKYVSEVLHRQLNIIAESNKEDSLIKQIELANKLLNFPTSKFQVTPEYI